MGGFLWVNARHCEEGTKQSTNPLAVIASEIRAWQSVSVLGVLKEGLSHGNGLSTFTPRYFAGYCLKP